jgi:hypothetical protein
MNVRYRVELSQGERDELKALLNAGKIVYSKSATASLSTELMGGQDPETCWLLTCSRFPQTLDMRRKI